MTAEQLQRMIDAHHDQTDGLLAVLDEWPGDCRIRRGKVTAAMLATASNCRKFAEELELGVAQVDRCERATR